MLESDEAAEVINAAIIRAGMISIVMFIGCFAMCLGSVSITLCRYGRNKGRHHVHKRRHRSSRENAEIPSGDVPQSSTDPRDRARNIARQACDVALQRLEVISPLPSAPRMHGDSLMSLV